MSNTSLPIQNSSPVSDLRVLAQDFGADSEKPWVTTPRALIAINPMGTGNVLLHDSRRAVLETSSADDVLLTVTNPSLQHTLKLISLPKKKGEEAATIGFIPKRLNGEQHSLTVAINSRTSAIVQQMPT